MTNAQHQFLHPSQLLVFISLVTLDPLCISTAIAFYIGILSGIVTGPMVFSNGNRIPQNRKVSIATGDFLMVIVVGFIVWFITIQFR